MQTSITNEQHIRFRQACEKILDGEKTKNGIGTLGEKTLHAVLKAYYEPYEDNHEIKIGGYVADIVGENGIIEIQTRQFNKLRRKLENFLPAAHVTVVYPIPATKWLSWMDMETGETTAKRKSPKKGTAYHAFDELYKIKYLLTDPQLSIRLVLIDMLEYRYLNGWSTNKKKGSSRKDRIPLDIVEEITLSSWRDYAVFLPEKLPIRFTSKDYHKAAGISLPLAQTGLNILTAVGVVERVDKQGNSIVYQRTQSLLG